MDDFSKIWDEEDAYDDGESPLSSLKKEQGYEIPAPSSDGDVKEDGSQASLPTEEKENGDIPVSSVDDLLKEDNALTPSSSVEENDLSNRLIDELNTIGVMDDEPPIQSSPQLDTQVERYQESDDEEDHDVNPDKPWRSKIWRPENFNGEKNVVKEELPTSDVKSADNSEAETSSKKKKKKKKKKRSSEDEKLFKEMATKICELGKLLVRQRNKTKKVEELLAVSEDDVLFLSRRFQQLQVEEENDKDKEQLSRILEKQQNSDSDADANGEDMSSTTTATLLNVKLRETKAKLRMEQQERQKFEEELLDLRTRFADSQNHAHDLEQELNFHTAKTNELQSFLNEKSGDAASVLEGIDLKSRLKVVQYDLQKSRDQVQRLELERESNHGLVAELSSIIDPKGLFEEDLSGVLENVRDGVEVNPSKAQELTIQHLTSLLEQAEDDKTKHVEKICSLQEQLALVKEELDQCQNGHPQLITPTNGRAILSRFRRSPRNGQSPHSVMSAQSSDE
mmetsp:Transcript_25025/g.36974  ORF Transcript_25025/g.36974 Transcript_25025/m.36974 type:complete len:509 (+) Transcript_25025:113-1639(+)